MNEKIITEVRTKKEEHDKNKVNSNSKEITLEQKNEKVQKILDRMNRTIGVRLGPKNIVKYVMNQLEANKRYDKEANYQTKYMMAMHHCINRFFEIDLKMDKDEYKNIKIENVIETEAIDCDLIYIVFKSIEDISKVNSKF